LFFLGATSVFCIHEDLINIVSVMILRDFRGKAIRSG
jgi:hypothetical protein